MITPKEIIRKVGNCDLNEKEQDFLFDINQRELLAQAILESPQPYNKFKDYIALLYHFGSDWGYPSDLECFFKHHKQCKENPQLLEELYNSLYYTKLDLFPTEDARNLAKKYFPKHEKERLENFLT